ncbi:hypothetical protein AX16_002110 [Volvariella volvacea WC 439]|nr:hypothetical protein AX16_002110 [Volvariella volvacea WC 439]
MHPPLTFKLPGRFKMHTGKKQPTDAEIQPYLDAHARIAALFLGPKAENAHLLKDYLNGIVDQIQQGREDYFPTDQDSIIAQVQNSAPFNEQSQKLKLGLNSLLTALNQHAVPFWSPRYSAHMTVDQSLPGLLGYVSALFYNPNNVAFEASPLTTLVEHQVGLDLAQMTGYNIYEVAENGIKTSQPVAWGHITCDGTIANLESIWASRNLKFYPLSLRDAMAGNSTLSGISSSFKIRTACGKEKLFARCDTWELLNLPVATVLDLPDRIIKDHGIDRAVLNEALEKYLIQSVGMRDLLNRWGIMKEPVLLVPSTKHYSWPKGAAIAGIGSKNVIDIPVNIYARMDIDKLRAQLDQCLKGKRPVYTVVAVIGTTEEGAVDMVPEIISLRDEYRAKGLSFVLHADAAWGGYFATMLPAEGSNNKHLITLHRQTEERFRALKYCDSITIDPHKAGYIPYPAGSLVYRDGRTRYLLTWSAPYLDGNSSDLSIGVYGVEGSKPGAAASAVYLAHQVIGLDDNGHGSLLRQVSYTCRRFSSHWAAMSAPTTPYIVVPFNPLQSELHPKSTPEQVEAEKAFIRSRIWGKSNQELLKDPEALVLLNNLGSDLNINIFACNFRLKDGTVNKDIELANVLNRTLFEEFSVTSPQKDPRKVPFFLTSTVLSEKEYGECAEHYKKRLGLQGKGDLFVLRNVVMSPFTSVNDFIGDLARMFETALSKHVEALRAAPIVSRVTKPTPVPVSVKATPAAPAPVGRVRPGIGLVPQVGGMVLGLGGGLLSATGAVLETVETVVETAVPAVVQPATAVLDLTASTLLEVNLNKDIYGRMKLQTKAEWRSTFDDLHKGMIGGDGC